MVNSLLVGAIMNLTRWAPTSVTLWTDTVAITAFRKGIVVRLNRRVTVKLGKRIIHKCLLYHRLDASSILQLLKLSL